MERGRFLIVKRRVKGAASCRFGGGRLSGLRPLEPPVLKRSGSTVTCQRVLPAPGPLRQ